MVDGEKISTSFETTGIINTITPTSSNTTAAPLTAPKTAPKSLFGTFKKDLSRSFPKTLDNNLTIKNKISSRSTITINLTILTEAGLNTVSTTSPVKNGILFSCKDFSIVVLSKSLYILLAIISEAEKDTTIVAA